MTPEQANELSRLAGLWATARCRKALVAHGTGAQGESPESVRVREQRANEEFHQYLRALVQQAQGPVSDSAFEDWAIREFSVPSVDYLKTMVYGLIPVSLMQLSWNAAIRSQRQPLTEAEILGAWAGDQVQSLRPVLGKNKVIAFARAIEAAHGIKEST